ncbi:energy-coupling factor ABC transporter permease [Methanorbis rubei]|uniref:Putative cobalt transport protein CbiM n=1 Tax=Methanorbis rubei TaxID=3028300 RepID=A0AAE4SBU7_9EURY|nr:Cobalt transport protein CbiM [Methanocorpusculaceae archaeon Cs1]
MHIMEGFLPGPWWQIWTIVAAICVVAGIAAFTKLVRQRPETLPLLGLAGAFVFILSSLKIPSLGSSSHPTGTGFGAVLFGPAITSVFCTVVLVFQALFLAHGGLTTLGANIVAMGVIGPLAACLIFRVGHLITPAFSVRGFTITMFSAAAAADLATYAMTSLQLALAYPAADGGILATFLLYIGIFGITQIPLAVVEGIAIVLLMRLVITVKPEIFVSLGILSRTETKTLGGVCDAETALPNSRKWVWVGILVVLITAVLAFSFAVYGAQPGTDDIVAGTLEGTGVVPWFEAGSLFSEEMHGWLFALQAALGTVIVIACLYWLRYRTNCGKGRCGEQKHTIFDEHILDDAAMASPLRHVPAWLKLVLCITAIIIAVTSPLPYVPLFIAAVMIAASFLLAKVSLHLYSSLLMIPVAFAGTGALVILFITGGGETLVDLFTIGPLHLSITTNSVALAVLVLSRTFAGMCCLYFLALTTPMTSLFEVLKSLRFPQEFVDLAMLIYRYIFVFIGEAISIHNAQVMRGGYGSFRNWISSFSMLASMLFIRTWDRGESIFLSMDSRCYDGCMVLPEEESRATPASVFAVTVFLAAAFLLLIFEWRFV